MKRTIGFSLILVTAIASGCAREAGYGNALGRYGEATQINFDSQDAYNVSSERLRSLSDDFRNSTSDTVTFAFDRAGLDSTARAALDTQVAWLKANKSIKMTIIGHADLVGSERYNKGLGLRRARAVLRYLSRNGISRKRLEAIASRGESEPVVQTDQRERRNRRAQTTVSGFARNFVGTGLDGEVAARVYDQYQSGTSTKITTDTGSIN